MLEALSSWWNARLRHTAVASAWAAMVADSQRTEEWAEVWALLSPQPSEHLRGARLP